MTPNHHPFRHKWNFYRGNFWCLIGVAILLVCGVAVRLFMVWPKINPNAKPLPRIITCTVWAGCVHQPERTFVVDITWNDSDFSKCHFFGNQRKDDSLTQEEWDRFSKVYDPTDKERRIDLQWRVWIPDGDLIDICDSCNETADLYLLGTPNIRGIGDRGWFTYTAIIANNPSITWEPKVAWWGGAHQIYLTMSEDGLHGPHPVLPMLALPSTNGEEFRLHVLISPYGASTFMNQKTEPVENMENAIQRMHTFEKLMGWQFVDKVRPRLKKRIENRSDFYTTIGTNVNHDDLEMKIDVDASGWEFSGPLKISDGDDGWTEIIYHKCTLRVNRDGNVSFRYLKHLVERYPGYQ
ncbi:hypothetical protein P3T73_17960 [Kiritimatiellota bacterium B12222]|nr:hypothetical protein P3T73_17960 [Kiritimatiellota bacterium B12222]